MLDNKIIFKDDMDGIGESADCVCYGATFKEIISDKVHVKDIKEFLKNGKTFYDEKKLEEFNNIIN